ncbi:MAG: xanthine dehydrogenase family protein subunit M [Rhodospirillaceae bacterium]|nr:xanthine dehydrogenase family protein subunit M [Rhodospirillaceae bacterium]
MSVPGFHRPATVEAAVALLGTEGVRCLSGGATLVALINANLAEPTAIVSLNAIPELAGIEKTADGGYRIGAMTRHRDTAASHLPDTLAVVSRAAGQIANPPVRNMGTMGGSIAFADPAADYPPALVAARAEIEIAGAAGRRRIAAEDFFVDWYTTALEPGEMVTAIFLPPPRPGIGRYRKFARVSGDFAIASVALSVAFDGSKHAARIAIGGCGPKPVRLDAADALLSETFGDPAAAQQAGALLAAACDPVDDVRASAEYRRIVVPRLVAATIADAAKTDTP